ncbi:MAG TPA: prolyl oligopeptidase family serine peptidase [Longimicrobiaceae bacterium]|nr:prolyl oligopeptidase family serine peptidase [Longimicrobiaceae bacterium]
MRTALVLLCLALPAAAAGQAPQPAAHDGQVVSRAAYRLAPFDSLAADQQRALTRQGEREGYERARRDAGFTLSRLRYRSDGLEVVAYLAAPAAPGAGRLPVVVYNRGSWVMGDQAPVLAPLLHRLVEAGFVVVAPQYRGSDGGEGRDEMGGADVADVLNAVTLARSLPGADPERLYMYGESRGGMMTYQAIREGAPVRAAAVVGAFTDVEATMAGDERSRGAAPQIWPDWEQRRAEIVERRSALRWADRLAVPLLILHGGADRSVSPRQSLALAERLDALGRPYELHVFAGEGHTLAGRHEARDRQVAEWFRRHSPE